MLLFKYQYDAALILRDQDNDQLSGPSKLLGWTEHNLVVHCCESYEANHSISNRVYRAFVSILKAHHMLPYSN